MIEVIKNKGGWGGVYRPNTVKVFAVKVNGSFLRSESGAIRTFSSHAAAVKAANQSIQN